MKFHKYADLFPLLEGDEFDALTKDIHINGLLEPIWTYQGEILDGRNRFRACEAIGIEPELRDYEGNDPLSFVIAMNIVRRHLSASQKAMIAVLMLPLMREDASERMLHGDPTVKLPEGSTGDARDKAGQAVGVSGKYVDMASTILENAPALAHEVQIGEMPIPQAYKIAKMEQDAQRQRVIEQVKDKKASTSETDRIISDVTGIKTAPTQAAQKMESPPFIIGEAYKVIRKNIPLVEVPELQEKWLAWAEGLVELHREHMNQD